MHSGSTRRRRGHPAVACAAGGLILLLSACAPQRYTPAPLEPDTLPRGIATGKLDLPEHRALASGLGADGPWPPAVWTCAELGVIAVQRSRAVAAAVAEVAAAQAAVTVAGQRPNPSLGLTLQYDDEKDPGDDTHYTVGPMFQFIWSPVDRGRIRAALADADVVASRARVLDTAWTARDMACRAALDLHAAQVGQGHLEQRERLLEAAVNLARAAAEAGISDAFEWQVLKLDANSARLARLDQLRAITTAGALLAGALALPLDAVRGITLGMASAPAAPLAHALVQRHALGHHPRVLEALAAYDKAERDLELEIAAQYPDIVLSPAYLFDQGDNVWSLVGGVVVPLFATQDARIAAATARRDSARTRFESVQAGVIADVQTAHAGWQAAHDLREAVQRTQAEVARTVQTLEAQFAAGAGDGRLVARARVQQAVVEARRAEVEIEVARTTLALERSAAVALTDAPFGRYLTQLYAGSDLEEE